MLNLLRESPFTLHCRFAFADSERRYLVTDYYPGGSLEEQLLADERGRFRKSRARLHGVEVLLALQHMHDRGVCHRDLKLSNVAPASFEGPA